MTLVCFYIRDEIRHGISDTPQSIPTALPRVDPQTRLHNRLSCKCKCKCKLSLHIRVLANAAHRAKLLLRVPLPIRLPGHDHDATLLMWQPFVHPAKPSQGANPTASTYAQHPDAVCVVVRTELTGSAGRHHRLLAIDRTRTSGAVGEVALLDIEADLLAFLREGHGLPTGAAPPRVVSALQLLPPADVRDSLSKANLSVIVFDRLSNLAVMLPLLRKGVEQSRLWAPVTPRATACPDATIRAAILHTHDEARTSPVHIADVSSKAFGAPLQNPAIATRLAVATQRYQVTTVVNQERCPWADR